MKQIKNRQTLVISMLMLLQSIFATTAAIAQENLNLISSKEFLSGGFLTLPIEFPIFDNAELNTALQKHSYADVDFAKDNYGIGLQFYTNRYITSISYVSRTADNDKNTYTTQTQYRSFSVSLGYDLIKATKLSIYPYLGYKSLGLDYKYTQKAPDDITFEEYLATSLDHKELGTKRANIDFGLGISLQDFYLLNFRFGWLLPLQKGDWRINNAQDNLGNALKLNSQIYFSVTIGLGGISKTKPGLGFATEGSEKISI